MKSESVLSPLFLLCKLLPHKKKWASQSKHHFK